MKRNRPATEQRILDACRDGLLHGGFVDFGINAVAAAADCDKVLIYRYFGNFDGLLRTLAERTAFTPQPNELPTNSLESYLEAAEADFAGRKLTLVGLRWESAVDNPFTRAFRNAFEGFWHESAQRFELSSEAMLPYRLLLAHRLLGHSSPAYQSFQRSSLEDNAAVEAELPTNLL